MKTRLALYAASAILSVAILAFVVSKTVFNSATSSSVASISSQSQLAQVSGAGSGLIGYWNFDEGSGSTAGDSSGSGNNGSISGATWTTGKVGSGALSFSGTNSVNLGSSGGLEAGGSWTLSGWVNLASLPTNYPTIIARGSGTSNYGFGYDNNYVFKNGGGWWMWFNDSNNNNLHAKYISTPSLNTWYLLTAVWDDANHLESLYLNGSLVATNDPGAGVHPTHVSGDATAIGEDPCCGDGYMTGKLDDIRLYNRALQASDISQLYALGSGGGSGPTTYTFSSSAGSNGLVASTCGGSSCGSTVNSGTNVSIQATANNSYSLGSWTANPSVCSGTTNPCTFNISANTTVTANFTQNQGGDTTAPTVPTNLVDTAVSSSQINLTWTASTDAVGVTGYTIYRGGVQVGTSLTNSYSDSGLQPSTQYTYNVTAHDAVPNTSAQSSAVSATTQAGSVASGNIYVSQSGAGTGASCADPRSAAWFNTSANWAASGSGKIIPGTTVHLCGTISTSLATQGSGGTSGNPITILFESGAKLSAPTWASAILTVSGSNLIVDGGMNGIIEATNQGTTLGVHTGTNGVTVNAGTNIEVKNLTVRNIYVRTPGSTDECNNSGGNSCGVDIALDLANSSNVSIHDNTLNESYIGVSINYGPNNSALSIYNNRISRVHWGIGGGDWPPNGSTLTNVDIHDNTITDTYVWEDPADDFHLNGIYIWAEQTGDTLSNVKVHHNTIGGNMGTASHITAFTWFSGNVQGPMQVYDNIFYSTSASGGASNGFVSLSCAGGTTLANPTCVVYNNTFYSQNPAGLGVRAGNFTSVKNNVFYNVTQSGVYAGDPGNTFAITSDYNDFYALSTNQFKLNGNFYTPTQWQALGLDTHSIFTDPKLNNPAALDFTLQTASPAVDTGTSLASYFTTDKNGVTRPQGTAWDMGAYETAGSGGGTGASGNIYVSQSGAGTVASCADPRSAAWFNTAANWGASGAGKIIPGTIVHLCGTFTGTSGSTMLTFQGSGTSGNRITLMFEPGAVLTAPYWSTDNGAILTNGNNYITIDGGTNGIIRNTANGTAFANQQESTGMNLKQSHDITVQNLSILDIYIRTAFTGGGTGFDSRGMVIDNGDNILVTHNTLTNVKCGLCYFFTANHSNLEVSNNTFTGVEVPVIVASVQANTTFTTFLLHDNDFAGGVQIWDDPVGNSFHHEALHMWAQAPGGNNHIVGTRVYNNYIHGIWGADQAYYNSTGGSHITTLLYFEQIAGDATVYNNVLDLSTGGSLNNTDNGMIFCKEDAGQVCNIYNNTFVSAHHDVGFETAGGSGHTLKNNIFYNVSYPIYLPGGNNTVSADYNLYFGADNWGAAFDNWTGWRNSGQDTHGLNGSDPKLNANYALQSASPAINAGVSLSSLNIATLNVDKVGTARGASWDMGAYESSGGGGGPTPDVTAPTVSITAPTNGSTVSGSTVSLSASASDPTVSGAVTSGVSSVQFKVDGTNIPGALLSVAPYSGHWDTTTVSNGSHTLTAQAIDGAGNPTTSAGVNVTVSNIVVGPDTTPPTVPTGLTATAVSSSQINLTWNASTDPIGTNQVVSGVSGYQLFRNGAIIATLSGTSFSNTGLTQSTQYSYKILAYDLATPPNQSAQSGAVTATTQTPPPPPNPPVPSGGSPTGALSAGTTQATLSLSTDIASTCKYSTTANTVYSSIVNTFGTTGNTSHSQLLTGLTNGATYTYYIRCQSSFGLAMTGDYIISFSVANPIITPPGNGGGPGGSGSGAPSTGTFTPTVPQPAQGGNGGSACIPTFASSTLAALPTFVPALTYGMTSTNVVALQSFLVGKGYLAKTYITGYYGSLTQAAVMKYTADRNTKIPVKICSVTLNPTTLSPSRLPRTFQFPTTLITYTTNVNVKNLQIFLNDHGYTVSLSGAGSKGNESTYYGPATIKALASFQARNNIFPAVGNFGPLTKGFVNTMIAGGK